jgi:hypothetical protein
MSDLDLPEFDFSDIDLSDIDLTDIELSDFELPDLRMPDLDVAEITKEIAVQINISPEQLTAIIEATMRDFLDEEISKGVTDPNQISADLSDYLGRSDVQAAMAKRLSQIIDPTAIQGQVADVLQKYMENVIEEYIDQVRASLQAGMQEAIQNYMTQMVENLGTQFQSSLQSVMQDYMTEAMKKLGPQLQAKFMPQIQGQIEGAMRKAMSGLPEQMQDAVGIDRDAFAEALGLDMSEEEIYDLMASLMNPEENTYEHNLTLLGYADPARPSQINIYPLNFDAKQEIENILSRYNKQMEAEGQSDKVVHYTDIVGTLISSVTDIINTVSFALIAFVAISLVVSSIMIGVITYISVLERRKEIGILRAMGASKRNIREIFNAETLIIGFVAGVIGILATLLFCIPVNIIVEDRYGIDQIARLPISIGIILIAVSMFLTFIAGLFPSSTAARKNPVEALRSE